MKTVAFARSAFLFFCTAIIVCAQSHDLSWFTIDGGGGTSSGGTYSVSGTIGQPDAGVMSGGNYTLVGGFWGFVVAAIQTPGAPRLSIERIGSNVRVFWPLPATSFVLDRTATLNGSPVPWTPVGFPYQTNATEISVTILSPIGNQFFRLRKP